LPSFFATMVGITQNVTAKRMRSIRKVPLSDVPPAKA
jgi:hypothetical protein